MTDNTQSPILTRDDILAILAEKLDGHFELLKQTFPTRGEMEAFFTGRLAETLILYPTRGEIIERVDEQTIPILNQLERLQNALKADVTARNGEIVVRAEQAVRLDTAITAINTLTTRFETHEANRELQRREMDERHEKDNRRVEESLVALAVTVQQHQVYLTGDARAKDGPLSVFGRFDKLDGRLDTIESNQQKRLSDDQQIVDFIKRAEAREARWEAAKQYVWTFITSKKGAGAVGGVGGLIAILIAIAEKLSG